MIGDILVVVAIPVLILIFHGTEWLWKEIKNFGEDLDKLIR